MDPTVRDAVLRDPRVQEAVKKAGQNALSNPEVQQCILEACQRRFPEIAATAQAKVREWARDPEVQRQAYACAGLAAEYTRRTVGQVTSLIEQGPAGLRILAFAGGAACCINSALFLFGVLDPAKAVSQLVGYVLHGYLTAFALTTMLFEAKPEWIQMVSGLDMYQNLLLDKAQFLSEVLGRGLFYGFQGTLWLSFASITALQNYALGLWLLLMATLHICMHFGVMPHEVVAKMNNFDSGYRPVATSEGEDEDPVSSGPPLTQVQIPSSRALLQVEPQEEPPPEAADSRPPSSRRREPAQVSARAPREASPRDEAEERLLASLQAPAAAFSPQPPLGRWSRAPEPEKAAAQEVLSELGVPPKTKHCCTAQ